jgi:hypothetical protein
MRYARVSGCLPMAGSTFIHDLSTQCYDLYRSVVLSSIPFPLARTLDNTSPRIVFIVQFIRTEFPHSFNVPTTSMVGYLVWIPKLW